METQTGYKHLSSAERSAIMIGLHDRKTMRSIARELGRSASTLSREIGKHRQLPGCSELAYECSRAAMRAHMARMKRRRVPKLDVRSAMFPEVCALLRNGWSPQQISGVRSRQIEPAPAHGAPEPGPTLRPPYHCRVSHETIYTALYALPRGELKKELIAALRQGHVQRWPRTRGDNRKNTDPMARNGARGFVTEDSLIGLRPLEVDERIVPGHWEGDLIKGAGNKSCVGVLVERTTRYLFLIKMDDATAQTALMAFSETLRRVEPAMRKTLTYDRGSEMAKHKDLAKAAKIAVFFADPHAPWQRGTCENTNGLLRQYLPKGTDLSVYSQGQLNAIANRLNTRPRKTLGFDTPVEVYARVLGEEKARLDAIEQMHQQFVALAEMDEQVSAAKLVKHETSNTYKRVAATKRAD